VRRTRWRTWPVEEWGLTRQSGAWHVCAAAERAWWLWGWNTRELPLNRRAVHTVGGGCLGVSFLFALVLCG